jgi:hypothetical protein
MRPALLRLPLHVGAAGRGHALLGACRGAVAVQARLPHQLIRECTVSSLSHVLASHRALQSIEPPSHSTTTVERFLPFAPVLYHTLWFDAVESTGRINWVVAPAAARGSAGAGWRCASDATGEDANVDLTINTLSEDKEM